jgi:3-deoxy-D-manno-octulosonate 8-phosphate phosphatase (KDO 8-P phosphatase)
VGVLTDDEVAQRARLVRLVLLDVDGVLTDGTIYVSSAGTESKAFSIRDGAAIVWARRAGLEVGLLSGRSSGATTRRANELGMRIVSQAGPDKRAAYTGILETEHLTDPEIAYMGDDVLDLPILGRAGLATAPADAVPDVKNRVHWVAASAGGRGAVRELLELILRARGSWDQLVRDHTS